MSVINVLVVDWRKSHAWRAKQLQQWTITMTVHDLRSCLLHCGTAAILTFSFAVEPARFCVRHVFSGHNVVTKHLCFVKHLCSCLSLLLLSAICCIVPLLPVAAMLHWLFEYWLATAISYPYCQTPCLYPTRSATLRATGGAYFSCNLCKYRAMSPTGFFNFTLLSSDYNENNYYPKIIKSTKNNQILIFFNIYYLMQSFW